MPAATSTALARWPTSCSPVSLPSRTARGSRCWPPTSTRSPSRHPPTDPTSLPTSMPLWYAASPRTQPRGTRARPPSTPPWRNVDQMGGPRPMRGCGGANTQPLLERDRLRNESHHDRIGRRLGSLDEAIDREVEPHVRVEDRRALAQEQCRRDGTRFRRFLLGEPVPGPDRRERWFQ